MRDSIEEELRFLSYLENIKFIKGAISVWDNFWQLKALQNDEKCSLFQLKSSFRTQVFILTFWSSIEIAWLKR